jgi:hypothetical protein
MSNVLPLRSTLPPVDDIKEKLRIVRIVLSKFPSKTVEMHVEVLDGDQKRPVYALVTIIDSDAVRGYLPTKLFPTNEGVEVLFYTNPKLPDAARPFKQGKTYIALAVVEYNKVIQYDADLRVLIDQFVSLDGELVYVFVFGDEQYDSIVMRTIEED